jgi:hypothetical protein
MLHDLRFGIRMLRKQPGLTASRGTHVGARHRRDGRGFLPDSGRAAGTTAE